jgi:hypothetical protein
MADVELPPFDGEGLDAFLRNMTPVPRYWVVIKQEAPGEDWKWAIYSEDPELWESTPENLGRDEWQSRAYRAVADALVRLEVATKPGDGH